MSEAQPKPVSEYSSEELLRAYDSVYGHLQEQPDPSLAGRLETLRNTIISRFREHVDGPPTYTMIKPACPRCGCSKFESSTEDVTSGFDDHKVHTICADCDLSMTIQYRAIDIVWFDDHDGFHAAVAHGSISPRDCEYESEAHLAPLPEEWNE